MRMLRKAEIQEFVEKYRPYLYVEQYHASKPTRYLKIKVDTPDGSKTLGRVPKNIFTWYDLEFHSTMFINVSQYTFK